MKWLQTERKEQGTVPNNPGGDSAKVDKNGSLVTITNNGNGMVINETEKDRLVTESSELGRKAKSVPEIVNMKENGTNKDEMLMTAVTILEQVTLPETTSNNTATTTLNNNTMEHMDNLITITMNSTCNELNISNSTLDEQNSNNSKNGSGCQVDQSNSKVMKTKRKVDYIGYITTPIFFLVGIIGK